MQHPTLTNVRIRSTRDALQIFYAVARNILPMTTRRLDAEERRAITSGCVYIWEERCANSEATGMGMERWTDGMGWGPSRVRDEFLFYHQRENEVHEDPNNPSARWASMMRRRDTRGNLPFSRSEAERLIKQTYSVHVSLPEDRPRGITRKWHLTAYFSQTTLDSLGTIDSIPGVGDVPVPEGMFKSARASKINKRNDPMPVEDIGAATHEPWSMSMPPSLPPYGQSPPKWATGSPQPAHIPRQVSDPYTAAQNAYPTPRSSYESADYSARPLSSHTNYSAAPLPAPLPNLHDTGLTGYRDPSPYTHSSCSSSEPGTSPRTFSSPLTPPSNAPLPLKADKPGPKLVPLSYLQSLQQQVRPRDPLDELALKRFSTPDANESHRRSWAASPLTPHASPYERFEEDDAKPTLLRGGSRW
ncbi:Gti1/Pac2 family-domain-containing protein [Cerioporus squamosus]|nr:Gti1/Pac2 family-domain-containing protein [Cerioporus squamosus]